MNFYKAYSIVGFLIIAVVGTIKLGQPLYLALLATVFFAACIAPNKTDFITHIQHNVTSVRKTILLLLLISLTLPVLMASGALPNFIYYMSHLMVGKSLLLSAFILGTLLSMVLGTAIGTLTILIPLFLSLSSASPIPFTLVVGALLSGAYFGDRASPLSSGLHLASSVSGSDYQKCIPLLIKSSIIPYAISMCLFALINQSVITQEVIDTVNVIELGFHIHPIYLLPLGLMVGLILLRKPINQTLLTVMVSGLIIIVITQQAFEWSFLWTGYRNGHSILQNMLKTTGLQSMLNVLLVILLSAILNGILEAGQLIEPMIYPFVKKIKSPRGLIRQSVLLSLMLSAVTCSQAMTAIVSGRYLAPLYDQYGLKREYLVMSIANMGLGVVAMIPWNVNGLVIKELTGIRTISYLPYSFFILLLAAFTLVVYPFAIDYIETKRNTGKPQENNR